jgi:2-methylisocitrate lyase-like PEP mutase family enzyme
VAASAERLRQLLDGPDLLIMPCCFDVLSARLVEQAGFPLTFMSGFAVAAARLALPDTGLISYAEMLDQGRSILDAVSFPVIGYRIAAYPLTLLTSAVYAMQDALCELAAGRTPQRRVDFAAIREIVGFDEYEQTLDRYSESQ